MWMLAEACRNGRVHAKGGAEDVGDSNQLPLQCIQL